MLWRYGKGTVREWYFEVWNEPNLQNGFFEGTREQFFELWKVTWLAIKAADHELRIGGPSTARAEWLGEFLEWSRRERCVPDYVITHIYNNDSASQPLSPFDGPQENKANTSPHFAAGVVRGVRKLLDEIGFKGEVHWNEWGRSWYPCYPERETPNEGAFVCKTMAEVSQLGDCFAYWNLSDIYDQVGYGRETFHGNYGLLNLQGLRKPAWHAFQLLGRLGTERLLVETTGATPCINAIATRHRDAVLVYAFEPDEQYASTTLRVHVQLPAGIRAEDVRLFRVTANENNILRPWEEMGRPAYLRREEAEQLRQANHLTPATGAVDMNGSHDTATFELTTPGVVLLEVEPA
jgi:xylan 1,4-beta-xylosidase